MKNIRDTKEKKIIAIVVFPVFQYSTSEFRCAVAKIIAAKKPLARFPDMLWYNFAMSADDIRKNKKPTSTYHRGSNMPKHAGKAFIKTLKGQ